MWHAMHIRFSYKSTIIGFYIYSIADCRRCLRLRLGLKPGHAHNNYDCLEWKEQQGCQQRRRRQQRWVRQCQEASSQVNTISRCSYECSNEYISSQVGSKYRHRFDLRAALSVHSITLRILVLIGRQTINNFACQVTAWSNDTLYSSASCGCWVA